MYRIICCLALFFAAVVPSDAQPLADRVPGDAIVYIGWRGTADPGSGYAASRLKQVVDQSNISAAMNDFVPRALKRIGMINADAKEATDIIASFGGAMWKNPTAMYFAGVDFQNGGPGGGPMPRFGFVCQAGAAAKDVQAKLEQLLAKSAHPVPGLEVFQEGDLVGLTMGIAKDDLAKGTLIGQSGFVSALKNIGGDPSIVLYADFDKLWTLVDQGVEMANDPKAKEMWPKVRDALGLTNLHRLIATSGFDGADWSSQAFLEIPSPRKGIFATLEGQAFTDEQLKKIPADAAMAFGHSLDLAALIDAARTVAGEIDPEGAANVDKVLGLASMYIGRNLQTEVLAPLGSHWLGYTSPSVAGRGFLGMVIVNKPDDIKKAESGFMASMLALCNSVNGQIPERLVQMRLEKTKAGDLGISYLATPLITPAWAFKDGYMYAGLYPQSVAAASKYSGKSIIDNEQFAAMRKRINAPSIGGFSFTDLHNGSDEMYQVMLLLSRMAGGVGDLFGVKSPEMIMPTYDVIKPHMTYVGNISWADDAGWHSKEISPFPGGSILTGDSTTAIGVMALQTSILLPSLNRARETANRVKCASNQRQLAMALLLYANDHKGKYPDTYEAFIEAAVKDMDVSREVFICPSSSDELIQSVKAMEPVEFAKWAVENSSYVYLAGGKTTTSNAEDILIHEKMTNHDGDGINITYGDGHVEFHTREQAEQELQRVGAGDANQPPPPPPAPTPRRKGGL